jgi:snurportin-1
VNPECFIYKDEATDDYYKEELVKFRFDNTITMTLGWHRDQLMTRDDITVANHPSS